jgi:hypothetical protein
MKKLQTEAISIILISGIIITLVGTAYFWGKPLIEKRTTITQLLSIESFMDNLNNKITDMASTCATPQGCEEAINLPVKGLVMVDSGDNSIKYNVTVPQGIIISADQIPLNTGNLEDPSAYGETPGVITLRGARTGGQYILQFKLHYRELDQSMPKKGYRIKLDKGSVSGNEKIRFSYQGVNIYPGAASGIASGGDLIETTIRVDVI